MLDWYSKRQRRVCRSTFGAELNGFSDGHEHMKVIGFTLEEIISKSDLTAADLCQIADRGLWQVVHEACIDCRSLFDSLACEEVKIPSESALIMVLLRIKEQLQTRSSSRLWWVSATDMCADALNKGSVSRSALLRLSMLGDWQLLHDVVFHSELPRKDKHDQHTEQHSLAALVCPDTASIEVVSSPA